jgi:hypothetical protein
MIIQDAVTALAPPLESVPIQLVVQKVHVSGGPDCLVMFDNGFQTTLVLNSYAREAKLKKVGDSHIQVRGIGPGKLEPNVIYEVPLVKLDGGTVKIQAHGVDHVIGEMLELDFAPAKQAFISIP